MNLPVGGKVARDACSRPVSEVCWSALVGTTRRCQVSVLRYYCALPLLDLLFIRASAAQSALQIHGMAHQAHWQGLILKEGGVFYGTNRNDLDRRRTNPSSRN